jgi:RNA polymerase sigma factor (sigma-70 family)
MVKRSQEDDRQLVKDCLAGSSTAWNEFYSRFVGLMRTVVRRHGVVQPEDVDDITQTAFLTLTTALQHYDPDQSLPRFVCVVTDRVLIDEYRRATAVKRAAEIDSGSFVSSTDDPAAAVPSLDERQDELLEKAELAEELRRALSALDVKCRELLTRRFLQDLSFKEISSELGVQENTLIVQTRRCLDALRAKLDVPGKRTGEKPRTESRSTGKTGK